MIVRGFKSVIWVATVGGAALSCYMVSLQVATERADLAKVERQIVAAKRDIRSLQTELGTRGRLSQLEQWNAEVLALAAPSSAQFLQDEVKLARFEKKDPSFEERSAEVRMAALSTGDEIPAVAAQPRVVRAVAADAVPGVPAVHQASYTPRTASLQTLAATPKAEPQPKPAATAKAGVKSPKPSDLKAPARSTAEPVVKTAGAKPAPKAPAKAAPAPTKLAAVKADAKPGARPAAKAPVLAKADTKATAKPAAEKPRSSRLDGKLTAEIRSGTHKGQGSGGN